MPVNLEKEYTYVHIPKTGGSSIEKNLGLQGPTNLWNAQWCQYEFDGVGYSPQHLTLPLIKKVKPETENFKSFTVVRNPYEKAISEYFMINFDFYKTPKPNFEENDFEKFLEEEYFIHRLDHTLPQHKFIDDTIDKVVKLKDLDEEWWGICDFIGEECTPLHNENPGKMITHRTGKDTSELVEQLSPIVKDKIYKHLEKDFDTFEYTKEY